MCRTQITVGGPPPGMVVLSAVRSKVAYAMANKPTNSISPWPLVQFLPPVNALASLDCRWTTSYKME